MILALGTLGALVDTEPVPARQVTFRGAVDVLSRAIGLPGAKNKVVSRSNRLFPESSTSSGSETRDEGYDSRDAERDELESE